MSVFCPASVFDPSDIEREEGQPPGILHGSRSEFSHGVLFRGFTKERTAQVGHEPRHLRIEEKAPGRVQFCPQGQGVVLPATNYFLGGLERGFQELIGKIAHLTSRTAITRPGLTTISCSFRSLKYASAY